MSKKNISGVSEALTEQMKERFTPIVGTEKKENSISVVSEKVRKNFYIEKHLVKLLRKVAYEKETDQTKIVNSALESYFKEHGYI